MLESSSARAIKETVASSAQGRWKISISTRAIELDLESCKFLGLTAKSPIGLSEFVNLFQAQSKIDFLAALKSACEHGRAFDIVLKLHSGKLLRLYCFTEKSLESQKVLSVQGVVIGVDETAIKSASPPETIFKSLEDRLLPLGRLSLLGDMLGSVTHEINNPLAVIEGRASQVREMLEDKDDVTPEFLIGVFKKIETCADRITALLKNLRSFAKASNENAPEVASLCDVIQMTVELCDQKIKTRGIELRLKFPEEGSPKPQVNCHPLILSQAMMSLLYNAIEAVDGKKEAWIEVNVSLVEKTARITVSDNGSGVAMGNETKIFEPFFSTKKAGQGAGLGLTSARKIVEIYGGKLWLDLNQSSRSTFVIELPATQQ